MAGGYYWNVFIFSEGVDSLVLNDHPYESQYYINVNREQSGLSYVLWSDISKSPYGFWQGNCPDEKWGTGISGSMAEKIKAVIEHAIIYKGDNLSENAAYIQDKLYPGPWTIVIGDPAQSFGGYGYQSKSDEYAILSSYGIMKWSYLLIRV